MLVDVLTGTMSVTRSTRSRSASVSCCSAPFGFGGRPSVGQRGGEHLLDLRVDRGGLRAQLLILDEHVEDGQHQHHDAEQRDRAERPAQLHLTAMEGELAAAEVHAEGGVR